MPLHDVSPGSLGDVRCKAYNNTTFSLVSDLNNHAITLNSNDYDPRGMHSTVTNTSRITVPISGRWYVYGHVLAQSINAGTGFLLGILKNGSGPWAGLQSIEMSAGGNQPYRTVSGFLDLVAGDYVEMYANQNSGSTVTLGGANLSGPELEVQLIAVGGR